jgi:rubredoxin
MKEHIMELELECFECLVCGYVYNPEEGDPAGAIPPGMTFFSLPDDWLCPECSAGKNDCHLEALTQITLCDFLPLSKRHSCINRWLQN